MEGDTMQPGFVRARAFLVSTGFVLAFGLTFKAVAVLAVLFAAAVAQPDVAVAAAVVYVLAYTFQLGLSLMAYFGTKA